MKKPNNKWLVLISVVIVIGYVVLMISTQSFGVRCKQAGYTGADFGQCVERLASGGSISPMTGAVE